MEGANGFSPFQAALRRNKSDEQGIANCIAIMNAREPPGQIVDKCPNTLFGTDGSVKRIATVRPKADQRKFKTVASPKFVSPSATVLDDGRDF